MPDGVLLVRARVTPAGADAHGSERIVPAQAAATRDCASQVSCHALLQSMGYLPSSIHACDSGDPCMTPPPCPRSEMRMLPSSLLFGASPLVDLCTVVLLCDAIPSHMLSANTSLRSPHFLNCTKKTQHAKTRVSTCFLP